MNLELLIDMFADANSIYLLRRFDISACAESIYPRKSAGENDPSVACGDFLESTAFSALG